MSEKFNAVVEGDLEPLSENVLVTNLESGERVTNFGLIIPDDDGGDRGIRPRWCQVYRIGSEVWEVSEGQWILVDHGRWSRGVKLIKNDGTEPVIRMVDRKDILLVGDERPAELA